MSGYLFAIGQYDLSMVLNNGAWWDTSGGNDTIFTPNPMPPPPPAPEDQVETIEPESNDDDGIPAIHDHPYPIDVVIPDWWWTLYGLNANGDVLSTEDSPNLTAYTPASYASTRSTFSAKPFSTIYVQDTTSIGNLATIYNGKQAGVTEFSAYYIVGSSKVTFVTRYNEEHEVSVPFFLTGLVTTSVWVDGSTLHYYIRKDNQSVSGTIVLSSLGVETTVDIVEPSTTAVMHVAANDSFSETYNTLSVDLHFLQDLYIVWESYDVTSDNTTHYSYADTVVLQFGWANRSIHKQYAEDGILLTQFETDTLEPNGAVHLHYAEGSINLATSGYISPDNTTHLLYSDNVSGTWPIASVLRSNRSTHFQTAEKPTLQESIVINTDSSVHYSYASEGFTAIPWAVRPSIHMMYAPSVTGFTLTEAIHHIDNTVHYLYTPEKISSVDSTVHYHFGSPVENSVYRYKFTGLKESDFTWAR
jgi:hypothetical protein